MPEKKAEIFFEKFFSEILKKSRFLQGFCKGGGRIIRVRNKEKNNKKQTDISHEKGGKSYDKDE